jgi:hypothetical protein
VHVVLASHLPGEGCFRSATHPVQPVECRGDCDYWAALDALWGTDLTIVNLEHDLEVTDEHLDELVACEHPLCSWTYQCHFASTGQPESIIAAGTGDWAHHLQGGEEWADWSAIGLVKITPRARTGPLVCRTWQHLERSVHNAVRRPWHMHGNTPDKHLIHHHWG